MTSEYEFEPNERLYGIVGEFTYDSLCDAINKLDSYFVETKCCETEGKKNDTGKVDWSLLHPDLVEPLIAALEYGEKEYGYENWQNDFGPDYRRRFCAARRRHEKDAWNDPLAVNEHDGGCYYLAQVAINALFELYHARKKAGLL